MKPSAARIDSIDRESRLYCSSGYRDQHGVPQEAREGPEGLRGKCMSCGKRVREDAHSSYWIEDLYVIEEIPI